MKIALIYLGRRGSGGPISLALAGALAACVGVDVSAWLSNGLESLVDWSGAPFPVQTVDTFSGALAAAWSLAFPYSIRSLAVQVRAWGPDVLLFPMAHPWNAALQRDLAPIPAVVMVHDPRPHPDLAGQIYARLENASLRAAAACLILSRSLQADMERRGVPHAKIAVVPHGPLAYPSASAPAFPSNGQTVLFLGRITPYKGLEVLLAAFERLSQRRPDLRLHIAGEGGLAPYRAELARLPNVDLTNRWLDDAEIGALLGGATLLALPYTSASQSGVLAAAASFGLPVIATRVGGLPEQITSDSTGLLVAPGSVDELESAIERLLDDPAYAAQLGAALKYDYAQNRTWAAAAAAILKVCEQLHV